MDNSKTTDSKIEQLKISRTRWLLAIPGFIILGLLCGHSMILCTGTGDNLGCGMASFFVGSMILGLGVLVAGIRLIIINHKLDAIKFNSTPPKQSSKKR